MPERSTFRAADRNKVGIVNGVIVAIAGNRVEAELIVGMLRSHGVRADFVAGDVAGLEPQLQLQGTVRVFVAPSDEAVARRLLDAADDNAGSAGGR